MKLFKYLRPGDYAVFSAVGCAVIFLFVFYFGRDIEGRIEVTGEGYREVFDPAVSRTLYVEGPLGTNKVVIENGAAWIEEAPCRDKVCIKMGKVKRIGDQAVCLPNRVIVEMTGSKPDVDGVSR